MRAPRLPAPLWGLLALAAGMALGTLFPGPLAPLGAAISAVFKGLAWAAPYIIFFTISAAVIDMLRGGHAGRFAAAVALAFTALGVLASLLSIVLVVPLFRLSWTGGGAVSSLGGLSAGEIVRSHLTPSLIAVLYAITTTVLLHYGSRWRPVERVARPTLDVVRLVGVEGIGLVGRAIKVAFPYLLFAIGVYIPTGIQSALRASERGLSAAQRFDTVVGTSPVALYFLTVAVQVLILFIFLGLVTLLVCWYTRFSVARFFREYLAYVYPFAWATSSSAASIPVNLERTGTGLGVRKEVREFIIPLGATVNLDGAIIAVFIITPMAAMLVGYRPTFLDLLLLVIPVKLVTMGVPGIPGGIAAVVPPVVADILPIPPEHKAAFLAIWFAFSVGLSDQFRTGVNTTTNGVVALLFEKWYPRHFARHDEGARVATAAPEADAE